MIKITCPYCNSVFFHNVPRKSQFTRSKLIWGAAIVAVIVIFALLNQSDQSPRSIATRQTSSGSLSSNWITISYGGLVDKSLLTHSGETVGSVISQVPNYDDEFKGLIQPYLEPFSILCHDVLLSINGPDTLPFVNIVSHYPVGVAQPAWVALFREGHYQLYYNPTKIRVFVKGTNAKQSFENNQSVIRHAMRDVINSAATKIDTVQVFVFTNDYAATEIRLNTIPISYAVEELDLEPRHRSLDLSAIEEFLNVGVILEAVEVDTNNDLYFYGRQDNNQTLAGFPLSLSDLAVVYRSVFHYGYNSPYISLDGHEDNRFAKVNFGGHLENTHAGYVVLEADKLFKALSTGIDPNTHKIIKERITRSVPDFLTEDERSLLENSGTGHTQIRYWFYPDSIGTVTDGSIGAVLTHQFLADVERMDMPLSVSGAVRSTISHLNRNFGQYERAFETFRELSTVGRIMSLINWLKGMDMGARVELDELLTVLIPAFTTPKKTKKMLAVTTAAFPSFSCTEASSVRDNSKVYYISDLLDKCKPTTSDKQFLEIASAYYDQLDTDKLAPREYRNLKSQAEQYKKTSASLERRLESLNEQIRKSEVTLDRYNSAEISRHNGLVDEYNRLLIEQESYINKYNGVIDKLNKMGLVSNCITSVGGGINLRPSEFKRISRSSSAPKIKEIVSLKSQIRMVGKISRAGNWIRSCVGKGGARLNEIPVDSWILEKAADGSMRYRYSLGGNDNLTVSALMPGGGWESETNINGYKEVVQSIDNGKAVHVSHPGTDISGAGNFSQNSKRIEFSR